MDEEQSGTGHLSAETIERLAAALREGGSDPNVFIMHPDAAAFWQQAQAMWERRKRHWYWRAWWRIEDTLSATRDRMAWRWLRG